MGITTKRIDSTIVTITEDRIAGFLDYLRVEKGLAANTVEAYARDLGKFARFLEKKGWRLDEAGPAGIREFLSGLNRQQLESRTIARQIVALRHFYRYLRREDFIASNPTENLESPRIWHILPKYLSPGDVETLLAEPAEDDPLGIRDRAILEMLYGTGLRVSELISLRIADVHLEAGYVRALGKGNKERIVPAGQDGGGGGRELPCRSTGEAARLPGLGVSVHQPPRRQADTAGRLAACSAVMGGWPDSARELRRICCGTALPRICLREEPTCGRSR